ncbi:MAG: NUDIX domain-containing protein [Pseudomonadota bacterium]
MIEKVCPMELRASGGGIEFLAFRHPHAGYQVVKGTIEPGEDAMHAARRELHEESGLTPDRPFAFVGQSSAIAEGQIWTFFRVWSNCLPDRWVYHCADDGGLDFTFFWADIANPLGEGWDPVFQRAIAYFVDQVMVPATVNQPGASIR